MFRMHFGNRKKTNKKSTHIHTITMAELFVKPQITLQHNWKGLHAHVMRKNGHIARCTIENLQVHDGETSIVIAFNEERKLKKKAVCPLTIAATHVLWLTEHAVSSDEEDNPDLQHPIGPPNFDAPLPPLVCSNAYVLPPLQQRKLKWKIAQTNNMLNILKRIRGE